MHILIASFAASFCFVALKAFQQLNVVHGQYLMVLPTSWFMAACEVYVVLSVARSQTWDIGIVNAIGLGGGLGCVVSMWVHKRVRRA